MSKKCYYVGISGWVRMKVIGINTKFNRECLFCKVNKFGCRTFQKIYEEVNKKK